MCPFCHNKNKKFAIKHDNLLWHCWNCAARGNIKSLFNRMRVPKDVYARYYKLIGEHRLEVNKVIIADTKVLHLPDDYKPLWRREKSYQYLHALQYVQSRDMTSEDILRYRIGYCEEGPYKNRIIIPSYDVNNHLNYFTARNFYPNGPKHKNPDTSKNVVCFENMVNWDETVILVEGMYDAIAIRRNAIPLLGKTLPSALRNRLVENGVKQVVVFLDTDAHADAMKLEHDLRQYNIDVKTVLADSKDASQIGFESAWKLINSSRTTNFKELISERLCNI